jgi:hypothetical protein
MSKAIEAASIAREQSQKNLELTARDEVLSLIRSAVKIGRFNTVVSSEVMINGLRTELLSLGYTVFDGILTTRISWGAT